MGPFSVFSHTQQIVWRVESRLQFSTTLPLIYVRESGIRYNFVTILFLITSTYHRLHSRYINSSTFLPMEATANPIFSHTKNHSSAGLFSGGITTQLLIQVTGNTRSPGPLVSRILASPERVVGFFQDFLIGRTIY